MNKENFKIIESKAAGDIKKITDALDKNCPIVKREHEGWFTIPQLASATTLSVDQAIAVVKRLVFMGFAEEMQVKDKWRYRVSTNLNQRLKNLHHAYLQNGLIVGSHLARMNELKEFASYIDESGSICDQENISFTKHCAQ